MLMLKPIKHLALAMMAFGASHTVCHEAFGCDKASLVPVYVAQK